MATDELLYHHGVLGMKWGVRKDGKPQGYQGGDGKTYKKSIQKRDEKIASIKGQIGSRESKDNIITRGKTDKLRGKLARLESKQSVAKAKADYKSSNKTSRDKKELKEAKMTRYLENQDWKYFTNKDLGKYLRYMENGDSKLKAKMKVYSQQTAKSVASYVAVTQGEKFVINLLMKKSSTDSSPLKRLNADSTIQLKKARFKKNGTDYYK